MKDIKQIHAIVKACPTIAFLDKVTGYAYWGKEPRKIFNPLRDLNAIRAALDERGISDADWFDALQKVILDNQKWLCVSESERKTARATAPQQCEAFLRILKKWEDE